jgi:hypothetical protein
MCNSWSLQAGNHLQNRKYLSGLIPCTPVNLQINDVAADIHLQLTEEIRQLVLVMLSKLFVRKSLTKRNEYPFYSIHPILYDLCFLTDL